MRFLAKYHIVTSESDAAKQAYLIRKNDNLPSILGTTMILGALFRGSILSYSFIYKNFRASFDTCQMTFLTNSSCTNENKFYLLSLLNTYLGSATFSIFLILHTMIVSRILVMKCDLKFQPPLCLSPNSLLGSNRYSVLFRIFLFCPL